MVAKIIKRTPTKSLKSCIRRKKSSPGGKAKANGSASLVISALHDSFFTCRRRLANIFSKLKLGRISTPCKKRKGFRKIKPLSLSVEAEDELGDEAAATARKPLFLGLPPPLDPVTRTIFLDLDETLIHSRPDPAPERYDFVVRPVIDGEPMNFYVLKRPGVDELLDYLSRKRYEMVVFTAGLREYASLVVDKLDEKRVISHRLYRDSCREMDGRYIKDLSQMGRDLKGVAIVDDNPTCYAFQPDNAIQIRPFVDDLGDTQVWRLIDFFHSCESAGFHDFREAIRVFAPFHFGSQNSTCC